MLSVRKLRLACGVGLTCSRVLSSVFFWAAIQVSAAQSGITIEGPLTVFRTGTNEPLLSLALPFGSMPTNSFLHFDFGFSTDELDLPDTFFDSFSATLQRNDQSATALLLTADRTGVQWAPSTPGGLSIDPSDVQRSVTIFPNLNPALPLMFSYAVTFALPLALTGGPLTLFFDLFDNLNQFASLAYVSGVRIETGVAPRPRLHSAAVADGIYAEETSAVLDATNRTFTLGKTSGNRFFRVFTDRPTRIVNIRDLGQQVMIGFKFETIPQLTLLISVATTGPFVADSNAVWNSTNQTFTLPKPSTNSFFRIAGNNLTRITGIHATGSQVIVEYQPIQVRLFSAGSVNGSYVDETGAVQNELLRTFTLSRPAGSRFYRIQSDTKTRIGRLHAEGNELALDYEVVP